MFGSGLNPFSIVTITIGAVAASAAAAGCNGADDVIVGRLLRRSLLFLMYDDSGSEKA